MFSIVRYKGILYRIPKTAFETEERAHDRAWYVAKKINGTCLDQNEYEKILNESHMYVNKKYFGMEY